MCVCVCVCVVLTRGSAPSLQMFNRAKRGLQAITARGSRGSEQENRVAKNVSTSLAISLQELSVNFRKSQSSYLKSESSALFPCLSVLSPLSVSLSVSLSLSLRTEAS